MSLHQLAGVTGVYVAISAFQNLVGAGTSGVYHEVRETTMPRKACSDMWLAGGATCIGSQVKSVSESFYWGNHLCDCPQAILFWSAGSF